jgi:hypothetical protein
MRFQSEHWNQVLRPFWINLGEYPDLVAQYGIKMAAVIWIPQCIMFFLSMALAIYGAVMYGGPRRRMDASMLAYLLVYTWFSFSPTWLLSGNRYMLALFPLYLLLGRVAGTRGAFFACAFVCAVLVAFFMTAFVEGSLVM